MGTVSLPTLIDDFVRQPAASSRAFRELRDGNPQTFREEILPALMNLPDSPGLTHLLRLMMQDEIALTFIVDPLFLKLPDAIRLTTRIQTIEPSVDARLLRLLLPCGNGAIRDSPRASRALEIVEAISDGTRTQALLAPLLWHTDIRVRSKAALLLGRFSRNTRWLQQRMEDSDPRVRANAIESLWGMDTEEARSLFLQATRDRHHRVAGNAIVALHRAGDLAAARIGNHMAAHDAALFRAAAVWAMGETHDPRFVPTLVQLVNEPESVVRRNALRALVGIRKRLASLAEQTPLKMKVRRRDLRLAVSVRNHGDECVAGLAPTAFVVMTDSKSIDIESIAWRSDSYGPTTENDGVYDVNLAEPITGQARMCVYTDTAMGDCEIR